MSSIPRMWGVPDVGQTVSRTSFHSEAASASHPVLVVAAPSGYGKTIAVAQFCRSADAPTLWIGLNGAALTLPQVLVAVIRALSPAEPTPASEADALHAARQAVVDSVDSDGLRLVLDDVSSAPEKPLLATAEDLLHQLSPFVSSIILTTRGLDHEEFLASRGCAVIDRRSLLLAPDEAEALAAQSLRKPLDVQHVRELDLASGGHVALFRMLLSLTSQGADYQRVPEPDTAALILVEQLLRSGLDDCERRTLEVMALLKEASVHDVESLIGARAISSLRRASKQLPLVRWDDASDSDGVVFRMHDLVADCVTHHLLRDGQLPDDIPVTPLLDVLAGRADWERIRFLLANLCDSDEVVQFVVRHGDEMQSAFASRELVRIIGLASLQHAMGSGRFMLQWASALADIGEVNESLAKYSAARMLSEHAGDYETCGMALAGRLVGLTDQGRMKEAIQDAERYIDELLVLSPAPVRCQLLLSYAHALGGEDRVDEASAVLDRCEIEALADPVRCCGALERLERYRVMMRTLRTGDWAYAALHMPALLAQTQLSFVITETLRGNLAWSLAEIGKLASAQALLDSLTGQGHSLLDAAYYPTVAMVRAAEGNMEEAVRAIDLGSQAAAEIGDDADLFCSMLLKATILRSTGRTDESLELAERSLEGLSRRDYYRYSHLAAIEVAASMISLGDTIVATRWLPQSTDNFYNEAAKRAVGIVAQARQTSATPDLQPLVEIKDFIREGSVNWRLAMYCRSFPELLGLLAAAVGAAELPLRLLRMMSTEALEPALTSARAVLSPEDWQILGERALGKEQFKEFVDRAGKPICRVRLFGGLEVVADGRPVVEKDWKKRKARMLFAMLALRNGQDLSRDVILEHLWPHLTEDKAKNNFYVVWSTMKSALMPPDQVGACPYIESRRGRCRVVKEFVHTDVDDIDALFDRVRQADAEGRTDDALAALQALMSFYRGDLLPGDLYDDWFAAPRERYRFEFIDAMLKGAELLMERDDPYEALVFARRALMMDPYREDLYQTVLRCQILAGQRSAAIETFIQCKNQLAEELGLDPTAETQALYQQILAMEEKPRYDTYGLTDN